MLFLIVKTLTSVNDNTTRKQAQFTANCDKGIKMFLDPLAPNYKVTPSQTCEGTWTASLSSSVELDAQTINTFINPCAVLGTSSTGNFMKKALDLLPLHMLLSACEESKRLILSSEEHHSALLKSSKAKFPQSRLLGKGYWARMIFLFIGCVIIPYTAAGEVDLNSLASSKGFRILGAAAGDQSGISVSALGDVNGDGIGDMIVAAPLATRSGNISAGVSYVFFGRNVLAGAATFDDIQLPTTSLPPSVGFRILGGTSDDWSGTSVSAAGDVNGDGIDDIIVGAPHADPVGFSNAGISYVIFGRPVGAAAFGDIQLTTGSIVFPPSIGFRILGAASNDWSGWSVSAAGDINKDGVDDIIVGAIYADPTGRANAGISYVIFGRDVNGGATAFSDIKLTTGGTALAPDIGFRILGPALNDQCGTSVSTAGDANGDGVNDIIVGAINADPSGEESAGISYVIFGRDIAGGATAFSDIQLTSDGTAMATDIGFRILGALAGDLIGFSVSGAGDVNGDGLSDVIVGARFADPTSGSDAGISYIIFGRNVAEGDPAFGDIQLTTGATPLSSTIGFRILGAAANDQSGYSVSAAGDLNGDGMDDIIVGARYADFVSRTDAGVSYVIFGRNVTRGDTAFSDIQLSGGTTALSPSVGFRILGATGGDGIGSFVSAAGDLNGDGIDDVILGAFRSDSSGNNDAGLSCVVFGAFPEPTSQPSSQPSRQPTRQPTRQPSGQPTRQPAGKPSAQPTTQPSRQPTSQPSFQPSRQPSVQPTCQPSQQPTSQPSLQPTTQPSSQPLSYPSTQPTCQPSSQPSTLPTTQPSLQPVDLPSSQPTNQPSTQPISQPSTLPTSQPSEQPGSIPSSQPTNQPSMQPISQPSTRPTNQPSMQPSMQPTGQPLSLPTSLPSTQPSGHPTPQPSTGPSTQPSGQPTAQPTEQPTLQPSGRPTEQPTGNPSAQPSDQPSIHPSAQPSDAPSQQPLAQPSLQPSTQPSMQPSNLPSAQPSCAPSAQPTSLPSTQPFSNPTEHPGCSPSAQPSRQPTSLPSAVPSRKPYSSPTRAPTSQPSAQPVSEPTSQPSRVPSSLATGEWVTTIDDLSVVTHVAAVSNDVWACGGSGAAQQGSLCVSLDAALGKSIARYPFPWNEISSTQQSLDLAVMMGGNTLTDDMTKADMATCVMEIGKLNCSAKSFSNTLFTAGSYVPFAEKVVYVGSTKSLYSTVSIMDHATGNVRSYIYTSTVMSTISLLQIHSPPNFIGGFIAGTCLSTTSVNYIFAGMVRTDSGTMTAMYLQPVKGTIVNSAELVNAMALEFLGPDSFIAGGLQLNDGMKMHAYVMCVNSLYRRFVYGMRYLASDSAMADRRMLLEENDSMSVATGIVLVESSLYMIVNTGGHSMSVLKTDKATGSIVQQVHIHSHNATILCNDIAIVGNLFAIACTVHYISHAAQSVVLSVNRMLTFSKLPAGFERRENDWFRAEPVLFKSFHLPLTVRIDEKRPEDRSFSTLDGSTTFSPSLQPSSAPSSLPSNSPSASPSISPQPTNQPSSSGPTNTYKPTAQPTPRPTPAPSADTTIRPSIRPTQLPSELHTTNPTLKPSATLSSTKPSPAPSVRPTRNPTVRHTSSLSTAPSVVSTTAATSRNRYRERETIILGQSVAGLLGVLFLYLLYRWCIYKVHQVKRDKKRVRDMLAQNLPGKPRYRIFRATAGLCCTMDIEEYDESIHSESSTESVIIPAKVPKMSKRTKRTRTYKGQGANQHCRSGS